MIYQDYQQLAVDLADWLNKFHALLQSFKAAHPETKLSFYPNSAGSILNAYREGDLSFDDARAALHQNEQSLTRELLDVLKAAREELRLLRMKDTPVVYEPTLRSRMDNVIDKAERRS